MTHYFFSSVTRISDLMAKPFETAELPRKKWATGDYVIGGVYGRPSPCYRVELRNGRMVNTIPGDLVIGTLGKRAATLEGVGDWEAIGTDLTMEALTHAGLFGKATSTSPLLPHLMSLQYRGHVTRDGSKLCMRDFALRVSSNLWTIPVVMLIGSSMSAGKTTTGRIIVHELKRAGLKVAAAKLTGAACYGDMLSFHDAGADHIFDFVDVGLPSTVCPEDEYRDALDQLLSRIADLDVDVLVAEAGASPLEPYNVAVAYEVLKGFIRMTVLCASDPYAVVGVQDAFSLKPDLVTGPAANTAAGIALVDKLTGIRAMTLMEEASVPELRQLLKQTLEF